MCQLIVSAFRAVNRVKKRSGASRFSVGVPTTLKRTMKSEIRNAKALITAVIFEFLSA